MHKLRSSKLIASLVLVWFGLFLGSAVASALIKPGNMQMVCATGGGIKIVSLDGNGDELKNPSSMDCPLCATIISPPLFHHSSFTKPSVLEHALHPIAAAHIAALTAPPLPSRGPPDLLI